MIVTWKLVLRRITQLFLPLVANQFNIKANSYKTAA